MQNKELKTKKDSCRLFYRSRVSIVSKQRRTVPLNPRGLFHSANGACARWRHCASLNAWHFKQREQCRSEPKPRASRINHTCFTQTRIMHVLSLIILAGACIRRRTRAETRLTVALYTCITHILTWPQCVQNSGGCSTKRDQRSIISRQRDGREARGSASLDTSLFCLVSSARHVQTPSSLLKPLLQH